MKLTLLGVESNDNGCPSLHATDRGTYVVQGWRLLDAEALSVMDLPDHETAVEVPAVLLHHVPPTEGRRHG
ncbi:MAG: hypothetical protein ACRDQ0_08000 [Pseudonocardia sp.]